MDFHKKDGGLSKSALLKGSE